MSDTTLPSVDELEAEQNGDGEAYTPPEAVEIPEPDLALKHQAGARRDRLEYLRRRYGRQVVQNGSEQASAIKHIEDHCLRTALIIEEKCQDGESKRMAHELLFQAKLLAVHAISHRL